MKVFLKGLYSCVMRKQKFMQYREFLEGNKHQIVSNPRDSDVILIWTCAFRGDVRDNSLFEVRRYQQEYKDKEVVVAGCLPDITPELLNENFSGIIINWRDDKEKMEELFGCDQFRFDQASTIFLEEMACEDAEAFRKNNPGKDVTFHDQFIKLLTSEGCNFNCAYCAEKLMFPLFRSFPEDELVESCRQMVEKTGQLEVILLADSLGDYGCDNDSNFPTLIRKLKTIHPDLKVALNNFNPASFIQCFDEMLHFLQNGDIRHLNLPIQSASDRVLKLMNRPYSKADIEKIFGILNRIGFTEFDTHIIIGFSGETEEDLDETIDFILRYRPKYVLASKYMETPEMPASKLPGKVSMETMKRRMQRATEQIRKAGIICNSDEGEIMQKRLKRLNLNN